MAEKLYQCKHCKVRLSFQEFGIDSSGRRRLYCRECRRAKSRAKTYKMPMEEQQLLLDFQGNRCILCQTALTLASAHVDHDHKTGKVRGFLCAKCNHYLHAIEEMGWPWVRRARDYLQGAFDIRRE